MSCPLAIATIATYCAGTDLSCNAQRPTGIHLFRVTDNVLRFDVAEGDTYELLLPLNRENRGLWSHEGLIPAKEAPEQNRVIDTTLNAGYYTLGVFKASPNVTKATLRRLAGNDRIGICRTKPPDSVTFTAWLALPFSRSVIQIWNQPMKDTPEIPLSWVACVIASIALCWARDTRINKIMVPSDVVYSFLNGSLLADAILWIALGVVVSEDAGQDVISKDATKIVVYIGLFVLAEIIVQMHYAFEKSSWTHVFLGVLTLFTSSFYLSTLLLWIWAIIVWGQGGTREISQKQERGTEKNAKVESLVF